MVSKTLLNVDLGSDAMKFKDAVKYGSAFVNKRANSFNFLPVSFPKQANRLFLDYRRFMDKIVYRVIDERLQSGEHSYDLLDMYLNSVDEETGERMSRKQLRDEVMTVFLAGFETTAIALTWTWYLLSKNPDAEAKLHAYIDSQPAAEKTMEDWFRTDYLSAVLKESMRLYPPVYNLGRTNKEDQQIGPYTLKKGGVFLINTLALHKNRLVWKDPESYIPDRFLSDEGKAIEKSAYIPFGAGQRMCIGHQFALLEMKIIIHTLASKFTLRLKEGHPVEPRPGVTLNPRYGMPMHIKRRY
jgi:cytochrome P450